MKPMARGRSDLAGITRCANLFAADDIGPPRGAAVRRRRQSAPRLTELPYRHSSQRRRRQAERQALVGMVCRYVAAKGLSARLPLLNAEALLVIGSQDIRAAHLLRSFHSTMGLTLSSSAPLPVFFFVGFSSQTDVIRIHHGQR